MIWYLSEIKILFFNIAFMLLAHSLFVIINQLKRFEEFLHSTFNFKIYATASRNAKSSRFGVVDGTESYKLIK